MISVILRTKNEERWIAQSIRKILSQSVRDIEIVLVDNQSTDKTVVRARHEYPDIKVVEVEQYTPGFALNRGIQASTGQLIAILSAHCLPVDGTWLCKLADNFGDQGVAGVYGRQIPLKYTKSSDKRDLLVTFGLDRRVQVKDSFFHNANSMIRRSVWEKIPFDETVKNIEDRVWGKSVIESGYTLVYEPGAIVHHYHGIHQDNDQQRADSVVRIMENLNLHKLQKNDGAIVPSNLEVVAIIPVRMEDDVDVLENLLRRTISCAKNSVYVTTTIISTDNLRISNFAKKLGAEVPFLRPPELSAPDVRVDEVLSYTLEMLESHGYFPDVLIPLEITYPFRPEGLLDELVEQLIERGLDMVMPGFAEYRLGWWKKDEKLVRVDRFDSRRSEREPLHIGLISMACATYPEIIRTGTRIGSNAGLVEIKDAISTLEVRDRKDLEAAERYIGLLT